MSKSTKLVAPWICPKSDMMESYVDNSYAKPMPSMS